MEKSKEANYEIVPRGKITRFDKDTNFIQLEFAFKPLKKDKENLLNTNQHIIIVLDKSGSMAGSAIKSAKEGILDMATYLHSVECRNITLITYQSVATREELLKTPLDQILKSIKTIEAGGGTSFRSAFEQIKQSITKKNSNDAKIVFFTDGQDGSAMAALEEFKKFVKECPSTEFHTIGFTESHNVQLLTAMTQIGKKPGTFQYCKNSADIKTCVESVTGLIGSASIIGNLVIGQNRIPLELDEQFKDNEVQHYKTNLFLGNDQVGKSLKIVFVVGDAQKQVIIPTESLVSNSSEQTSPIFLKVIFIKNEIGKALKLSLELNKNSVFNKELYDSLIKRVEQLNAELDTVSVDGNKLKNLQRKEFFPILFEVKELVAQFYSKLKQLQSGQLNNDKIASLNALAYRKMAKKGLQKKLDVRTQNNISVINEVYEKVKIISEKIDSQGLYDKYGDLCKRIGQCVYSANNFIEALKDQDCLCITYDVARSEAAVMDPTQIIIKDVLPSFIGVAPFLTSAQYAIKNNPDAHGGFNKNQQGSIIKGVARQDITGVLPLYICQEHWQIARQLIKPALGWTVTLDPLGYSSAQVRTVPFLVLSKLYNKKLTEGSSEFLDFQIELVEQTCVQIIKQASGEKADVKLNEEIIRLFKSYLSDPLVRTVDSIASNQVFLVQLHLLAKMKQIQLPPKQELQKFFLAVEEEEMRRRTRPYEPEVNVNSTLYELLNVDTEKYVSIPFKIYVDKFNQSKKNTGGESQYATKFMGLMEASNKGKKLQVQKVEQKMVEEQKQVVSTKPKTQAVQYEVVLTHEGKYKESQLNAIQQLNKVRKLSRMVLNLRSLFGLPVELQEFVLAPSTQNLLLSLFIQNKLGARNADRRDRITNNQYQNPYTEGEQFIRKTYIKLAEEEKLKRINQYIASTQSSASADIARRWLITEDFLEAGGLIHGVTIGKTMVYFYAALCEGEMIPHFKDKLSMLVKGQYKGVKLYADKFTKNQNPVQGWDISKWHSNRLFKANFNKLKKEEWMELLPKLREKYIDSLIKG